MMLKRIKPNSSVAMPIGPPPRHSVLGPFSTFAVQVKWITSENRWRMHNLALAAFYRVSLKINLKKGNLKSNYIQNISPKL